MRGLGLELCGGPQAQWSSLRQAEEENPFATGFYPQLDASSLVAGLCLLRSGFSWGWRRVLGEGMVFDSARLFKVSAQPGQLQPMIQTASDRLYGESTGQSPVTRTGRQQVTSCKAMQ